MCRPWRTVSSPTLTMAVTEDGGTTRTMPGEHAGSSDAAAEGDKHGASIEGTAPAAIRGDPWSAMGPAYWRLGCRVRPLDGRNRHSGAIEV